MAKKKKTHEEMLNLPGHKGNASLLLEWSSLRTQTTINVGDDVEQKEPSHTAGGNIN
jgi:hypothetical protein